MSEENSLPPLFQSLETAIDDTIRTLIRSCLDDVADTYSIPRLAEEEFELLYLDWLEKARSAALKMEAERHSVFVPYLPDEYPDDD